jgi:hypothetical protein
VTTRYVGRIRSREATFVDENNIRTASLKLPVVMGLINRGAAFHGFMTTYGEHLTPAATSRIYRTPPSPDAKFGSGSRYAIR